MATPDIDTLAREGADSVFQYVRRTAEPTPTGTRWQTLSFEDEPMYSLSPLDGVGGIALFLADYARLTGSDEARRLARSGLEWCASDEHQSSPLWHYMGTPTIAAQGGLVVAWLRLAAAGDTDALDRAAALARTFHGRPLGPMTEYLYGEAGTGVALLRAYHATGDRAHLDEAIRIGAWLDDVATRESDRDALSWPSALEGPRRTFMLGFMHGTSGVGYFLALLHQADPSDRWAGPIRGAATYLREHAVEDRGGLNWPRTPGDEADRCAWCHGAAGVGRFWTEAYAALREPSFLETARAAAECTYAYGDYRSAAIQCHGLSGNAELFLELYRLTSDQRWLTRAEEFARQCFTYRLETPEGDAWQTDVPGNTSPDYVYGATGPGHYFLRLLERGGTHGRSADRHLGRAALDAASVSEYAGTRRVPVP